MNCLVKKLSLLLATFTVLLFGFFITAHANQAFAHTLSGNVSDSSGTDIVGAVVVVIFIFAPAGSVALSGHIYDPLGNPLQDVEVELQGTNGNVANTDSSGAYSVTVASGTYTIKISSPTYDTLSNRS